VFETLIGILAVSTSYTFSLRRTFSYNWICRAI